MLRSLCLVVLVALCLSQQIQCVENVEQAAPAIVNDFAGNWEANGINGMIVKDFSYLVFQKNFTHFPEFYWVTHDPDYYHMIITEASTDKSKPSLRACKYAFEESQSPVTVQQVNPRKERHEIDVKWTEEALKDGDYHTSHVKVWRCTYNQSILNDLNSEPKLESPKAEAAPKKANQIKLGQELQKQEIANVSFANPPEWARKSYAHNKFGHCWRQWVRKIYCELYDSPDRTNKIMTVDRYWMEWFDWLAVYNLKEDALLIITGSCPKDICSDYKVTKISKNGERRELFRVQGLDADYKEIQEFGSSNIDVYVSEDKEENRYCFHFVCLEVKFTKATSTVTGRLLQYRRHCVAKDVIEK